MKNQKEMLSINKRVFMYNLYKAACFRHYIRTEVCIYYLLLHNTYVYICTYREASDQVSNSKIISIQIGLDGENFTDILEKDPIELQFDLKKVFANIVMTDQAFITFPKCSHFRTTSKIRRITSVPFGIST